MRAGKFWVGLMVVVITGFIVGCGGGGSSSSSSTGEASSSGELTKAEFIRDADAICTESNKKGEKFDSEIEQIAKAGATPKAEAETAAVIREAVPVGEAFQKEFAELTPPSEDQATIDHIEELQKETFTESEELAEALEEGQESKVQEVATGAEKRKATETGLDEGYGFKVCGQEEE